MIRIYNLILLLLLYNLSFVTAQSDFGEIRGVVKTAGGAPMESVNVSIKGTSLGGVTSASGEFGISGIQPGDYILIIKSMGYELREIAVRVNKPGVVYIPEIGLKEKASELPEILVQDFKQNKYVIDSSEYAARFPLRNIENPQTYSTAPKELFIEQNINTPASAVNTIPGGVISTEDGIGVLGLYLRGFYTQGYIRNGLLTLSSNGGDIQLVEKYELIKGPSGPLYGTSGVSYGGLLNKITKKPLAQRHIITGFSFGSFNLQRFTADLNLPLNENRTALFRFNAAVHSEGTFQDAGYRKTFMAAPSFYYKSSDKFDILFEAEINSIDLFSQAYFNGAPRLNVKSIDEIGMNYFRSYSSAMLDAPPSFLNNYSGNVNYKFSDNWKFSLGSAFSDFNLNGVIIIPNFLTDSLMIRQVYDYTAQYNTINIQPAVTGEFLLGGLKNKMILGLEYIYAYALVDRFLDTNADTINYREDNNPALFNDRTGESYELKFSERQSLNNYAAFISDILSITDRLSLMMSLRYTYYDFLGFKNLITGIRTTDPYNQSAVTPQAGFTYQLIKEELSLFANYMHGFSHIPVNSQGQSFKPEKAVQYEAGLKINISRGALSSSISYYYISVDNKIRRDPGNPLLSIQDGEQTSRGVDIDLRAHLFDGVNFITGYAYNESKFVKSDLNIEGKRPLGTPKHMANFWGTYSFSGILNGFGFGIGAVYSDDFYWNDINTLTIPSYILLKGSVYYNATAYRINFTSGNLLNKRYWDFEGTPQDPRNVILSLNLIF